MSTFTEGGLTKKLYDLNSSQQSIQTLSLWLIHHRKHHVAIVKTWFEELKKVSESKKLTFMYLANDVIQNSKRKGPEYGKEFANVLPKAFSVIGETCSSAKLIGSLGRILNIWQERGVYDPKIIKEYRARLNREYKEKQAETSKATENNNANVAAITVTDGNGNNNGNAGVDNGGEGGSTTPPLAELKTQTTTKIERRKHHHGESSKTKSKRPRKTSLEEVSILRPSNSDNDDASPYAPIGEAPEPEELIQALQNIENSASSDVLVRERIANLPPEISDISCLNKLQDKEQAKKLANQITEAVDLLNAYNARLAAEMDERTKLALMLRNYYAEQKELLAQAENRLEEYKKKLNKLMAVQRGILDHLSNLPDLTQLPDVTAGLAPLPSAGDLFNISKQM